MNHWLSLPIAFIIGFCLGIWREPFWVDVKKLFNFIMTKIREGKKSSTAVDSPPSATPPAVVTHMPPPTPMPEAQKTSIF